MDEAAEGGKLGTLGDVGFFSLGRGKALSCVEGGVILTNRDDIGEGLNGILSRLPRYGLASLLNLIFKAAALMLLIRPWLFWLPRSLPFLKLGETLFDPRVPSGGCLRSRQGWRDTGATSSSSCERFGEGT